MDFGLTALLAGLMVLYEKIINTIKHLWIARNEPINPEAAKFAIKQILKRIFYFTIKTLILFIVLGIVLIWIFGPKEGGFYLGLFIPLYLIYKLIFSPIFDLGFSRIANEIRWFIFRR